MLPIEIKLKAMLDARLATVIRASSAEKAVRAAEALIKAGYKLIEVTMTVPGATEAIKELASRNLDGIVIGGNGWRLCCIHCHYNIIATCCSSG